MKKQRLFILLILISVFFSVKISAQVQINSVSDSTAILNESFTSQVDYDYIGGAPSFELLEAPAGMNVNGTGLLSWTPTDIASGGLVTVRSWNAGGSDVFSFYVYVSDAVQCAAEVISYWKLDEQSGPSYSDFAGSYNATSLSTLTPAVGMVDSAQILSPANNGTQFLTIPDANQYEWTVDDDFSFAFWVYPYGIPAYADTTDQVIISRVQDEADARLVIGFDGKAGKQLIPIFRLKSNGKECITGDWGNAISQNQWHHLVFVHDAKTTTGEVFMDIYVDGVRKQHATNWFYAGYNFFMNAPLNIGWYSPYPEKFPFNGVLDEVLVYDKALSTTEVANMYTDGLNNEPHCKAGNYAPIFINEFITEIDEDATYSCTLIPKDMDEDDITMADSVLPSWLNFNPASGLLSGVPTNDDLGDTTVVIKMTDGEITVSKSFTITVSNVNDEPVITSTPSTAVNEDVLYTYTIAYSDVDPGDVLTLSAVYPTWLNLNTVSKTLSGTPTNAVLGTNEYVDFNVKVKVTDAAGDSGVQNFVIRVTNINDAPQILGQNSLSTPGSTAITLALETVYSEAHIVDPDNVFPDDFTLTVLSGPNYAMQLGNIVTPVDGFRGVLDVYATLSDGTATINDTINVSVNNSAPLITSTPTTSFALNGGEYVYNLTAEDADQDDVLSYSADVIPSWLDFNSTTHVLSGTPTEVGNYDVSLSVSDGIATAAQSFVIEITGTGLDEDALSNVIIYPVPAKDVLFVEYTKADAVAEFEILNLDGKVMVHRSIEANSSKTEVDLSEFHTGIYIFRLIEENNTASGKIVIE